MDTFRVYTPAEMRMMPRPSSRRAPEASAPPLTTLLKWMCIALGVVVVCLTAFITVLASTDDMRIVTKDRSLHPPLSRLETKPREFPPLTPPATSAGGPAASAASATDTIDATDFELPADAPRRIAQVGHPTRPKPKSKGKILGPRRGH